MMDVIEMGRRIKEARKEKGLTQEELGKLLGVAGPTVLRYEKGQFKDPKIPVVHAMANALGVNPMWLMGKTNQKYMIHPVRLFHSYPYIDKGISAGAFMDVEPIDSMPTLTLPDELLGKRYAGNKNIILMHVNGDSMNRVIDDGSMIAVLTGVEKESLKENDIVIAKCDGQFTCKRFHNDIANRRIVLTPDSDDLSFLPIVVSYDETLEIVGKVVLYCTEVS